MEANILWIENDVNREGKAILVRLYNPISGEIWKFDDLDREQIYQINCKVQALTA